MTKRKNDTATKRRRFRDTQTRGKLHVDLTPEQMAEHKYFFANATPDRLSELEERGYERVDPQSLQDAAGPQRIVGKSEDGDGHTQVLMRISKAYAEEDIEDKRAMIKARHDSILQSGGDLSEASAESRAAFAPGGQTLGSISEQ